MPAPGLVAPARHAAEPAFAREVSEARLRRSVRDLVALGPRMGGTPSGDAAARDVAAAFRAAGLDAAIVADPPLLAHWEDGWSVALIGGAPLASAHPYGFSPAVPAPRDATVLVVPDLSRARPRPDWAGRALYTPGAVRAAAYDAIAAGPHRPLVIFTSWPHEPGRYVDWSRIGRLPARDDHPIPVFALSYNDGRRLAAAAGREVRVSLEATIRPGAPRTVVATLPGRDRDAYYLICAHGDSDAGGPGADDNASGVAVVLELARAFARLVASGRVEPPAVSLRFIVWGTEYHSAKAYIEREGPRLAGARGVINFDQTGTGAEREAVYFESNDVPWNERLLRTLERVGLDYAGKPGFWPEFATTPSQGGTDAYAFLPPEHHGRGYTTLRIPATTIYTAAWDRTAILEQTPGWAAMADGKVIVDYSPYYHSSADLPEHTTERQPENLVRATKAAGLGLLRLAFE